MGRHTESDIVPYVIHSAFTHYDNKVLSNYLTNPDKDEYPVEDSDLGGWEPPENEDDRCHPFGKHRRLYATPWRKGGYCVYIVNEAEWASGGANYLAVCATTKASLKQFITDFKRHLCNTHIQQDDTVNQTL